MPERKPDLTNLKRYFTASSKKITMKKSKKIITRIALWLTPAILLFSIKGFKNVHLVVKGLRNSCNGNTFEFYTNIMIKSIIVGGTYTEDEYTKP